MSARHALVLLLALSAFAAACGEPSKPIAPGQKLFFEQGCVACHGSRGEGTFMGPPLRALAQHWTRERIAAYLLDPPATVAADERLHRMSLGFRTPMKAISAGAAERLLLADHVLGFN